MEADGENDDGQYNDDGQIRLNDEILYEQGSDDACNRMSVGDDLNDGEGERNMYVEQCSCICEQCTLST
jgi:hypothetical protein